MNGLTKKHKKQENKPSKEMRKQYVNVALRVELIEQIDQLIKKSKQGYSSRSEFVKEAVRNHLQAVKEEEKNIRRR